MHGLLRVSIGGRPGDTIPAIRVGIDDAGRENSPMVINDVIVDRLAAVDGNAELLYPEDVGVVGVIAPDEVVHGGDDGYVAHGSVDDWNLGQDEGLRFRAPGIPFHIKGEVFP